MLPTFQVCIKLRNSNCGLQQFPFGLCVFCHTSTPCLLLKNLNKLMHFNIAEWALFSKHVWKCGSSADPPCVPLFHMPCTSLRQKGQQITGKCYTPHWSGKLITWEQWGLLGIYLAFQSGHDMYWLPKSDPLYLFSRVY